MGTPMDICTALCYNKGCGKKYDPLTVKEDDCCFHPGDPIFHDAYKGWSCCNKKSKDFTTFLNMEGCTQGKHNPVKPPEPKKYVPDNSSKDEVIVVGPPPTENLVRPDFETEMGILKVIISQSLKTALENDANKAKEEYDEEVPEEAVGIRLGEPCKNNSCKATFDGEESNLDVCLHHPGYPVFHEGMKFWTCCNRKTSDFDTFLNQKGCTSDSHVWNKKSVKKTTCRYDWHQTATDVYVTVYAKLVRPELSRIKANPIRLQSKIIFGKDSEFYLDQELGGIIDQSLSYVTMAGTKVEIKMKKANCKKWNKLFLPPKEIPKIDPEDSAKSENGCFNDDPSLDVDAIDLSGI